MKFYLAICLIVSITATYGQLEQLQSALNPQALSEKCARNSGNPEVMFHIMQAVEQSNDCVMSITNPYASGDFIGDVFASKDRSRMVPAINSYCKQRPIAFGCVKSFAKTIQMCLEPEEIDVTNVLVRGIKKAMISLCENEGVNLSEFIANDGPECVMENKERLENCVSNVPNTFVSLDTLSINQIDYEQCQEYDAMKGCIYDTLSYCSNEYPATFVNDVLTAIKTELPC